MSLIPALMGWPMVMLAAILLAAGVGYDNRVLAGVGAVLVTPFLLYLAATPRFAGWALVPLVLNPAATFVVEKRRALAAILLVPGWLSSRWSRCSWREHNARNESTDRYRRRGRGLTAHSLSRCWLHYPVRLFPDPIRWSRLRANRHPCRSLAEQGIERRQGDAGR